MADPPHQHQQPPDQDANKRKPARQITYGKQSRKRRALFDPVSFDDIPASTQRNSALFAPCSASSRNMSGFVPSNHKPEPLVPKRPTSQKAATMAVQPSREAVEQLQAFVGCTADTAARWLKVSHSRHSVLLEMLSEANRFRDVCSRSSKTTWSKPPMPS